MLGVCQTARHSGISTEESCIRGAYTDAGPCQVMLDDRSEADKTSRDTYILCMAVRTPKREAVGCRSMLIDGL